MTAQRVSVPPRSRGFGIDDGSSTIDDGSNNAQMMHFPGIRDRAPNEFATYEMMLAICARVADCRLMQADWSGSSRYAV